MITCSFDDSVMTEDECLKCAKQHADRHDASPCGYEYATLVAMYNRFGRSGIHVTDITGCLLKTYFDKTSPVPRRPHEMLVLWLGIVFHDGLDVKGEDNFIKQEFEMDALGLLGRPDLLYTNGRLIDYKTTRWIVPSKLPYGSHELQVNIYAAMLRELGKQVNSAAIQYIDLSGPTKCRKCNVPVRMPGPACPMCGEPGGKEPHLGTITVEVNLWEHDEVVGLVNKRRGMLTEALENGKPTDVLGEPSYLCRYCDHRDICIYAE